MISISRPKYYKIIKARLWYNKFNQVKKYIADNGKKPSTTDKDENIKEKRYIKHYKGLTGLNMSAHKLAQRP